MMPMLSTVLLHGAKSRAWTQTRCSDSSLEAGSQDVAELAKDALERVRTALGEAMPGFIQVRITIALTILGAITAEAKPQLKRWKPRNAWTEWTVSFKCSAR